MVFPYKGRMLKVISETTQEVGVPVEVERVFSENGMSSHIEPPLDPEWSDLQKLQWHAAIVEMDTGVKFTIREQRTNGRLYYGYSYRNVGATANDYYDMWTFLNGFSDGHCAARDYHPYEKP